MRNPHGVGLPPENTMQNADVIVRQQNEGWMLLRDGDLRGMFSTRDAAIAEGRALVQKDRTTLWLQNDQGLREIGSYRIMRLERHTPIPVGSRPSVGLPKR